MYTVELGNKELSGCPKIVPYPYEVNESIDQYKIKVLVFSMLLKYWSISTSIPSEKYGSSTSNYKYLKNTEVSVFSISISS